MIFETCPHCKNCDQKQFTESFGGAHCDICFNEASIKSPVPLLTHEQKKKMVVKAICEHYATYPTKCQPNKDDFDSFPFMHLSDCILELVNHVESITIEHFEGQKK